eukprot:EG_transcript_33238
MSSSASVDASLPEVTVHPPLQLLWVLALVLLGVLAPLVGTAVRSYLRTFRPYYGVMGPGTARRLGLGAGRVAAVSPPPSALNLDACQPAWPQIAVPPDD